jgi:2Fe-2S ferredoxin
MKVYTIRVGFEEKGKTPVTLKVVEGESILDVALDNNIELHHNCGGVCACTTCQVYIDKGMENLPEMGEREEDYIDRALYPKLESRLACQCIIGGDLEITIPDQSLMLGH